VCYLESGNAEGANENSLVIYYSDQEQILCYQDLQDIHHFISVSTRHSCGSQISILCVCVCVCVCVGDTSDPPRQCP